MFLYNVHVFLSRLEVFEGGELVLFAGEGCNVSLAGTVDMRRDEGEKRISQEAD